MPQTPYPVSGTVYTSRGKVPNSVVEINSELRAVTDSNGNYVIDLANMSSDYVIGNSYTITSFDEFNNEYVSDTITLTGESLTKDVYLLDRDEKNTQCRNQQTRHVEIRSVGNKPVTYENPLIIANFDRQLTQKMENYSGGQPKYIGYAAPGTPTNEPKWLIIEMEYADGTDVPPTGRVYAKGNSSFDKVWDSRSGYDYS